MNVIRALFDFSFDEFVTTRAIKLFYGLLLAWWGLVAIGAFVGFVQEGVGGFFASLVVVPILFLVAAFLSRVWCETLVVVFRGVEHLRTIAEGSAPSGEEPEIR